MRALFPVLPLLLLEGLACEFDSSTRGEITNDAGRTTTPDARRGPTPDASATPVDAAPPSDAALGPDAMPPVAIRLNIAGSPHVGTDYPGTWETDPGIGGACGPLYYTNSNPVAGTVDDALFTNVAYGDPLICDVGGGLLPAGNYRVRLYFAEIYFGSGCPGGGGDGNRVFDIQLEGTTVQSDVDLHAFVGCTQSGGAPYLAEFDLEIADGTLDINMQASSDNAMVSAIEVLSLF